MSKRPACPAKF